MRLQRTDAAAQLALPGQGDEGRARFGQPIGLRGCRTRVAQLRGNFRACQLQQSRALLRIRPVAIGLRPESEGGVADHPFGIACGVAGVAHVQRDRVQAMPFGSQQQTVDRRRATGLLVVEMRIQRQDGLDGLAIHLTSERVGQEMRQIGTDHDQRLVAAPHLLQHLGHLGGAGVAHRQRQQLEVAQHLLQKRQLHFQRMFHLVRRRAAHHLRQSGERLHARAVQRDFAKRGGKTLCLGQCQPADGNAVSGTEQHHPADAAAQIGQCRKGAGGNGTGIDIAGMRYDQGLRRRPGCPCPGMGQQVGDGALELDRVVRVEQSRNGSGADGGHTAFPH